MKFEVLEYDPQWAVQFQTIKSQLETALEGTPYVSIDHVGSTSVPGLAAKPIIDIDIILKQEQLPGLIEALTTKGGYIYRGELGLPDRHMFKTADIADNVPKRHLFACIEGSQPARNHFAVRDLCRRDPEVRERYQALKLELSKRDFLDMDDYTEAKSELLSWMLSKAGMSEKDVMEITGLSKRDPNKPPTVNEVSKAS